ncbi:MAG: LacI family transcriptional regulator, partial [Lentisphaerae bacterium]
MGKKQAKLVDIAKRAKVSRATLYRVIYNQPAVSKETRENVLRIMKEMNYKPNVFAQGLVRKKNFVIAVLVPEVSRNETIEPHFKLIQKGFERAGNDLADFKLEIKYIHFRRSSEASLIKALEKAKDENVEGLIFPVPLRKGKPRELMAELARQVPVVMFYRSGQRQEYPIDADFITADSSSGGLLAGQLMNQLVREPGTIVVAELPEFASNNIRIKNFIRYFKENNPSLTVKLHHLDSSNVNEGFKKDFDELFAQYD